MKMGALGSNPAAPTAKQRCATTENHSPTEGGNTPEPGQSSSVCSPTVHPEVHQTQCDPGCDPRCNRPPVFAGDRGVRTGWFADDRCVCSHKGIRHMQYDVSGSPCDVDGCGCGGFHSLVEALAAPKAFDSPLVAHGVGGVPPLSAYPSPVPETVDDGGFGAIPVEQPRQCAGAPGCVCNALLGPSVRGNLCAHCQNFLDSIRAEEDRTSEADRDALEVAAACEAVESVKVQELVLAHLVQKKVITAEDGHVVDAAIRRFLLGYGEYASTMTAKQEGVFLAFLRDVVASLVRVHEMERSVLLPKGGGQ